eukprot:jgi/Picsp_1/1924/NSC_05390-R1_hypothetical protein COCSUDRAFT_61816 [Coccomyxa subellipsoidea C-169]
MKRAVCDASTSGKGVTGTFGACNRRRSSNPAVIGRKRFVSHFNSSRSLSVKYSLRLLNGHRWMVNMTSVRSDLNESWSSPPQQPGTAVDGEAVVEQAMVYLRKNDVESLESLLDLDSTILLDSYTSFRLGLTDGGVLSRYAAYFDAGSRRLLPSNLLRRCRVTSALGCTKDVFHVRMAVTSKSGEEGVVLWRLGRPSEESHLKNPGKNNTWAIQHVSREETEKVAETGPLPQTPHPRVSPEAVLRAHLGALIRGDVMQACMFCAEEAYPSSPSGGEPGRESRNQGYLHPRRREIVRGFLDLPEYKSLASHTEVVFGEGLLVDQGHVVQEVVLNAASRGWQGFLFHVQLKQNACWMITKIESMAFLS